MTKTWAGTRQARRPVWFHPAAGGLLHLAGLFEAVADGFMEEDSGPAGTEDDFHLTGRSGDGAKLQNRSARGLAGQGLRTFGAYELLQSSAPTAACRSSTAPRSSLR